MLPAPPPAPPDAPPPPATQAIYRRRPTSRRTMWGLAAGAAVGCAYVAVADPNQSASWYPQCPFRALTGYDCPGCGITRSIHAALTGHPGRALDHNALFVVVAVAAVVWFAVGRFRQWRGRPPIELRRPGAWGAAAVVVLVGFWVARNLPIGPLEWLRSESSGT